MLALKASYLHTLNPDWKIAVTFYTRSLYQQFEDLIRKFTYEFKNDEPDWDHLQILHAWGSSGERDGVYAQIAQALGEPVRNFQYAREQFGMDEAFSGICSEFCSL